MSYNYDEETIALIFHFMSPGVAEPTPERLEKYDNDLFKRYDVLLTNGMGENEIPVSKKSYVLALAVASNGGPENQVKRACEYYRHTHDME